MITLLCPSRGRPDRFRTLMRSIDLTAAAPGLLELKLLVDADDPVRERYLQLARLWPGVTVQTIHERRPVPRILNDAAMRSTGELVFTIADDLEFSTQGWDRMILEAFASVPDRILIAWTNDGQDRDKCQHWVTSRECINAVGYFCWPEFEHFCGDEMAERIAKAVGRGLYLRDLVTRHMHFKHRDLNNEPLAARDETYAAKRVRDRGGKSMTDRDQARLRAIEPEIRRASARLRAVIAKRAAA